MSKKLLYTLIASLFAAAPALAADAPEQFIAQGEASLGAVSVDTSNTPDGAKLREYRDLRNGALSEIFTRGRSGNTWFDVYGENFGRDDQYITARGGMYGTFKFKLWSDSLPHRFLYNGLVPYSGAGGNVLTGSYPAADVSTWAPVNIGFKRTDNGGYVEWQSFSPWYARVDANEIKFDGTRLTSSSLGTSPGNGFMDLVVPNQYKTQNTTGELGYNTGPLNVSVSYLHSKFTNNYDTVLWTNPFFGNGLDTTYLPPDNKFDRLAVQGTLRSLPFNSTFAARYAWSELKSDTNLAAFALNGTGAAAIGATNPNVSTFNGKHQDQVLNLTFASNPMRGLDTRIYYSFYDRDNKSTVVEYNPVAGLNCGGGVCDAELFSYTKHNVGLEGYYRFAPGQRIGAGYDHWTRDYEGRPDYDRSRENRLFVEYKNSMWDTVSGRIKYTHLERRSDFLWGNLGSTGNDADFLSRFVSAFDLQDLNRDELKATIDFTPTPMMVVSFEGLYRDNKYKNVTFGRQDDKRYDLYGSVSFGDFTRFRVTVFGDYEEIKYDAGHRYIGAVPCNANSGLLCNDPSQPPTYLAYNWSSRTKDKNWIVGAGADVPYNEKLRFAGSVLYYRTDGNADFNTQCGGSPGAVGTPGSTATNCPAPAGVTSGFYIAPYPITIFDDVKTTSLNLKAIYTYNRNWAFTLGYAYERYRYSDISYTGGQHTVPYPAVTNNTSQSYLSGYLVNPNYTANIVYGVATFRF